MKLEDFIKSLPSKAGVYQFYVYSLEKYYIGESVNIRRRVKEHLSGKGNAYLYLCFKSYGFGNIGFQVIEFNEDKQERLSLEDKYKKLFGFDRLLNRIEGKEETTNITKKAISCFDLRGNLINSFDSATSAAEFYKCHNSTISAAVNGKALSAKGLIWEFSEKVNPEVISEKIKVYSESINLLRLKQTQTIQRYGKDTQKKVRCKNLKTQEIKDFNSIKEAAELLNLPYSTVSKNLLNTHKSRNYEWSYLNV